MKKLTLSLVSLACMFLTGCGKRPYQSYKTTYKTQGAQQFDDKSVAPAEATKKNIKNMTLQEVRAARIYFEERDDIELIEKALAAL